MPTGMYMSILRESLLAISRSKRVHCVIIPRRETEAMLIVRPLQGSYPVWHCRRTWWHGRYHHERDWECRWSLRILASSVRSFEPRLFAVRRHRTSRSMRNWTECRTWLSSWTRKGIRSLWCDEGGVHWPGERDERSLGPAALDYCPVHVHWRARRSTCESLALCWNDCSATICRSAHVRSHRSGRHAWICIWSRMPEGFARLPITSRWYRRSRRTCREKHPDWIDVHRPPVESCRSVRPVEHRFSSSPWHVGRSSTVTSSMGRKCELFRSTGLNNSTMGRCGWRRSMLYLSWK